MLNNVSIYLDFLIALVFTIAIGSIILSLVFEMFAYYMKLRSKFLRKLIDDVLNDNKLNFNYSELFYNHPQIDLTKKTYRHLPAYISSVNFAQGLITTVVKTHESLTERFVHDGETVKLEKENDQDALVKRFKASVDQMAYSDLKILLTSFINTAESSKEDLIKNISIWYDEYMNRASGWYKTKAQKKMAIIGIALCLIVNVDIFRVANSLLHDKELSKHIANIASTYDPAKGLGQQQDTATTAPINDTLKTAPPVLTDEQKKAQLEASLKQYLNLVDSMYMNNAPVGWQIEKTKEMNFGWLLKKLLGCVLAGICLAIGAPFWFGVLNKLVNIRKAGNKPIEITTAHN